MATKEQVIEVLKNVFDPELRVDIYSLGLIYDIQIRQEDVYIKMTFTTPFCPYGQSLLDNIKGDVKKELGVEATIEVVFEPRWVPPEDIKPYLGQV